jgi:TRAP-type C4-dicarboxylate transport system substrate-binding protein
MMTRVSICARALQAGALLLAALVAAPGDATAQDKAMTVKLTCATINDSQHEWLKRFGATLEKSSGGRIKAEIYPSSQLGSIPRMIEMTQLGSIQVWVGPPEYLVGIDQRFELLSAPGLFENDQHAQKTIADPEFAKAFLAAGTSKGIIGAGLMVFAPTLVATRTPVRTVADFKGKKFRVLASPFQTDQFTRLGATGVPLTLGDVLPALQQGTIDGAFTGIPVLTTFHYQDVAKYATETGQSYIFSMAVMSKRWFDGLPADLQEQVMAAAKQAETEVRPWALDFIASQRKTWTENGGELIALPDAEKTELMAKLAAVGDDIVKTKPVLKPMWDQLVATVKQNK